LLAVIGGKDFDGAAHFVKARTDALADTLGQRVFCRGRAHPDDARARRRSSRVHRSLGIEKIRGQQGDTLLVVSRVQDVADGLKRPQRRFAGTDIVEYKNFRLQHRLKDTHLGGLAFGVVAVLDLLQQLAIIVEQSAVPAEDDFLERRDGKMRLANAAGAHQQQAILVAHGKFRGKALDDQFCVREAAIPCRELLAGHVFDLVVGCVVLEVAVTIAFRNACFSQHAPRAVTRRAVARDSPYRFRLACRHARPSRFRTGNRLCSFDSSLHNLPAAALADRTICSRHAERISATPVARKHTRACANPTSCGNCLNAASSVSRCRPSRCSRNCRAGACTRKILIEQAIPQAGSISYGGLAEAVLRRHFSTRTTWRGAVRTIALRVWRSALAIKSRATSLRTYLMKASIWDCISPILSRMLRMISMPARLTPSSRVRFSITSRRSRSESV